MPDMHRRDFTQQGIASLLTLSLLDTLFARNAFADKIKPLAVAWLNELNTMSADLKGAKLGQVEWQAAVEKLLAKVNVPDLLQFIDFDQIERKNALPDAGARLIRFRLPEAEGVPTKLVFGEQIFGMKAGRSVVPHGHDNMATAFLVLKGDFHGRHYDRIEDKGEYIVIKPTIDREFKVGETSTISDKKDNVHWFTAKTDGAYLFNIHVLELVKDFQRPTGRVYLDPQGEKLAGGRILAKRISYTDANKRYG